MDFGGYVRELSTIDSDIVNMIANQCNLMNWSHDVYARYEPPLKDGRLVVFPFQIKPKNYQLTVDQETLISLCNPVCEMIGRLYPNFVFVRGEVATLLPNVTLGWHRDPAWFHEHCHRIHVPVITNDQCFQLWEGVAIHLEIGKIYEINNRTRHSASNQGTDIRTHLIFDICNRSIWEDFRMSGGNPVALTCDPGL